MPFIRLRKQPSLPGLLSVFICKGCWILTNAFFVSIEMITWLFSFILLMWWIGLTDLWMLTHPCIPGINPTWSCCMILLMYCWIQFANILLRNFASMFIKDIGLWFSVLWCGKLDLETNISYMLRLCLLCQPVQHCANHVIYGEHLLSCPFQDSGNFDQPQIHN